MKGFISFLVGKEEATKSKESKPSIGLITHHKSKVEQMRCTQPRPPMF